MKTIKSDSKKKKKKKDIKWTIPLLLMLMHNVDASISDCLLKAQLSESCMDVRIPCTEGLFETVDCLFKAADLCLFFSGDETL